MLGIALEGGGAKGAYHIGALEACLELGYVPQAVAGTSIGAFNAAMFAQGDFERLKELWGTIQGSDVFLPDDEQVLYTKIEDLDRNAIVSLWDGVKNIFSDGGVDNSNMRRILTDNVDPEKLLASPVDFGIVAFSLSDLKPLEIFKDQMEPGNVHTYLLASAAFPGFQQVTIEDKVYIDGGVYDNCPVRMLLERGCDKVIAVRTKAIGVTRYDENDARVVNIFPSGELGSLMRFEPEASRKNMLMGYFDTLRALKGFYGTKYYFSEVGSRLFPNLFYSLSDEVILEAEKKLRLLTKLERLNDPKRVLFERLLPYLFLEMKIYRDAGYEELWLAMLENRAGRAGIERLKVYTPDELYGLVKKTPPKGKAAAYEKAIDVIVANMR